MPRKASPGVLVVLLAIGLRSYGAGLQAATLVIEGRVLSSVGAGVRGAVVRLGARTDRAVEAVSDAEGRFRFDKLASGNGYFMLVSAEGYANAQVGPLSLTKGIPTRIDVTLVAQTTDRPWVRKFEPGSTGTHSRLDADFIDSLPIIGHDYQDALKLAPGVTDPGKDGSLNVHGARDTQLQYRLDGTDVTDPVTGDSGVNLSPLVIQGIDIVTAGAPAELGRAMGGFANITTRSGGNDLEGHIAIFWQGRFLNGDEDDRSDEIPLETNDDIYRDVRAAAGVAGPIISDRLWYYAGLEMLNAWYPSDRAGTNDRFESRGIQAFGKLSLQAGPLNLLHFQVAGDPRHLEGQGLTSLTSRSSGFEQDQGGIAAGIAWTATLSSRMMLEARAGRFASDLTIEPESRFFERTETPLQVVPQTGLANQTPYPCSVPNCSVELGEETVYQLESESGFIDGPYFQRSDERRTRDGLRADLSALIGDGRGEHRLKGGFEAAEEDLQQNLLINPVLIDLTMPSPFGSNQVSGMQILWASDPHQTVREVADFSAGFYVMDSWKPRNNLVINAGLRFDRDVLDAPGSEPFDPRAERKRSIALWWAVCQEAINQGVNLGSSNCRSSNSFDGNPPTRLGHNLQSFRDENMDGVNDVAPQVAALDVDKDGIVSTETFPDVEALFKHFTTFEERAPGNFEIRDGHLSPRIGVSWDPWDDGKTRLFAHWGRYYDRLRPDTVLADSDAAMRSFVFTPDSTQRILPGALSSFSSVPSVSQVDRNLRAPHTDELSLGFERSLGTAWSIGVTYINRKAYDLLQDVDVNHYTCPQSRSFLGIDPIAVCGDPNTGVLETDRFGVVSPFPFVSAPNGAEDLYGASNEFTQVLHVGNLDGSRYEAYQIEAVRTMHRNWQMMASYTYSRARGEAENFRSLVGDDASMVPDRDGTLTYDVRHELKAQEVTRLPHDVTLGWVVHWASGAPFSVTNVVAAEEDSNGNILERTLFPTGRRNDQRNDSRWRIDGRVEKSFTIGKLEVAGFLIAENLLDTDTLVITTASGDGSGLLAARDFGRRFEIGCRLDF